MLYIALPRSAPRAAVCSPDTMNEAALWLWRSADLREQACTRLANNRSRDEGKRGFPKQPHHPTCPNLASPEPDHSFHSLPTNCPRFLRKSKLVAIPLKPGQQLERGTSIFVPVPLWSLNLRAIFVSYRRNDSQGEAGRLFDDLVTHFGEQKVFMDVAGIEAGRDFRKAIEESVANCGVLLVIIGPSWLAAKNEAGVRRLDDPADFVCEEVAAALRRDIPVIPVLVRGAVMPRVEQLPETLTDLAYRNGVELTHARWRSDVQLLIEPLRRLLGSSAELKARSPSEATVADHARPSSPELASFPKAEAMAASRVDAATLQRIRRELALHIGPIAELVVTRATPLCNSTEDLYLKVAEEIESPQKREDFLRKMNSPSLLGGTTPVKLEGQSPVSPSPQKPTHRADVDPVPAAPPPSSARSMSMRSIAVMIIAGVLVLALAFAAAKRRQAPGAAASSATSSASPQEGSKPASAPESVHPTGEAPAGSDTPAAGPDRSTGSDRVSLPAEIAQTLLVTKIVPAYPPLARQARVQGEVVLDVDISKEGTIEGLRTQAGHPMLIPAAIDAVKHWRYKPYLLNGEPVPVQTQVRVNFSLTSG
jgi:TonB family protein